MTLIAVAICAYLYEWLGSNLLSVVGLVFLTFHISDLLTKFVFNILPHRLIKNTSDKAVLITGCDSGFGYNLSCKLDNLGFKVYAGCLNVHGEGAQELKQSCSDKLHLLQLDVTKDDEVSSAICAISSTLEDRKLWSVVNNAGVACSSEVEWCPLEVFQRMFNVNTLGVVRVTKACLPLLRESQGRVVIVASMAGRVTVPGFTPYSMSKFAAGAFADGLRREMKKWGVSVHVVEPSSYKTNISVVEPLYKSLESYWDQLPNEILNDYGREYLEQFKDSIGAHMSQAKPQHKISEVVNDMLDAVAGTEPKLRYVPAMDIQFILRLLLSMPMEFQDHIFEQYQPKVLPSAVLANKTSSDPLLKSRLRKRSAVQRHSSLPLRQER